MAGSSPSLRWVPWIVLALIAAAFIVSSLAGSSSSKADLTYSEFIDRGRQRQRQEHRLQQVERRDQRQVRRARSTASRSSRARARRTTSPTRCSRQIKKKNIDFNYVDDGSNILGDILLWVLPLVLIIGLFVWMSRRAQGQMGAVMNIGRSRAKVYNTEKPKTTFADVAGYEPGEGGDHRGRRLPEEPGQVQGDRRAHPQGRAARRSSRHRQDADRTRGRR